MGSHGAVQPGYTISPTEKLTGVGNANELRDTGLSEDAISTPTLQIRD